MLASSCRNLLHMGTDTYRQLSKYYIHFIKPLSLTTQKAVDPCFTLKGESIGSSKGVQTSNGAVGPVYITALNAS